MYKVKLEKFEGPLDLLLQLIEQEEMDISEISLASIADEFIEYIRGCGRNSKLEIGNSKSDKKGEEDEKGIEGREGGKGIMNHESGIMNHESGIINGEDGKLGREAGKCVVDAYELSDFLVIAAKLLYIKSRYLMPFLVYDDEEEEIGDLENRLKIYKEFLDASKIIEEYYGNGKVSYVRDKIEIGQEIGRIRQVGHILGIGQENGGFRYFFPPEKLEKEDLKNYFEDIIGSLRSPFVLEVENMERTITVQEKIEQIRLLILKKVNINFTKMINMSDKKDIIVSFLSILELVKEQFIVVEQDGYFSEIVIRRYEL